MKTYKITIEADDNGWWTVSADDVRGVHSHGQTLARARENIREAIALMEDLPEGAEATLNFEERIILPPGIEHVVMRVRSLRAEAERIEHQLRDTTNEALEGIDQCLPGLGIRDKADLLGLSYQRIAQLRPGRPRGGRRPEPAEEAERPKRRDPRPPSDRRRAS